MRNEKDFNKIIKHETNVMLFVMITITTAIYVYLKLKGLY